MAYEKSPLLYRRLYIDKAVVDERDSRALVVGSATHALILEGDEAYQARYVTRPDIYKDEKGAVKKWNMNADYCRQWCRAMEGEGKEVLTIAEAQLIERMALGVESCSEMAAILSADGKPEVTIRQTYGPATVQCRFDWLTADSRDLDLKTCEDVGAFKHDARKRRYHRQRAWYRWVAGLEGFALTGSYLAAVEKSEPNRAKLFEVDACVLDKGQAENLETLDALIYSLEKDYWPPDHDGGGTTILGVGDFYKFDEASGALV